MSDASGAAFGVLGAGLSLAAGFIVLDAIAKTVKCTAPGCGAEMHHTKQAEHTAMHRKENPGHNPHKHIHRHDFGPSMDEVLGIG